MTRGVVLLLLLLLLVVRVLWDVPMRLLCVCGIAVRMCFWSTRNSALTDRSRAESATAISFLTELGLQRGAACLHLGVVP